MTASAPRHRLAPTGVDPIGRDRQAGREQGGRAHVGPGQFGLPETLGRYDVLGRLGAGGMAEVLLGRLEGAAGFERYVAIKRLLPHFAEDSELATMFVDEGRVLARIHHPNVVAVEDLVDDGDAVFLVMEHLVGESLANFIQALRSRRLRLPPALAVYIVAEAAAGLHAAHELRDDEGRPLRLVHRDVSPQNLFVTEQGEVKVLDFGIARHEDRLGITRTGHAPGKLAYMSPEQLASRPVDRRTDIFALGVVLFEALTDRRLFRRESDVATIRAVCAGPIPDPRELSPDVPAGVAEACIRALSRAPEGRFTTALQMRETLLDACTRSLGPGPELLLADLLRSGLGDQLSERAAWQREVRRRVTSTAPSSAAAERSLILPPSALVPRELRAGTGAHGAGAHGAGSRDVADSASRDSGGLDAALRDPALRADTTARTAQDLDAHSALDARFSAAPADEPPSATIGRPWSWGFVGLVAVAAFAFGMFWEPEVVEEGGPLLREPSVAAPAARPSSAPSASVPLLGATAPPAARADVAEEISLEVTSEPPGAFVEMDGVLLGATPLTVVVAREDDAKTLSLELDGHDRDELVFRPTVSYAVHRVLRRERSRRRVPDPVEPDDLEPVEEPDGPGIALDYP